MPEGSLHIRLDPSLGTPIYVQIMDQVRYHLARGTLRPEDELPSVRALSGEHLINPNTVARAYSILEREGLVHTKTGSGTFVADPSLRSRNPQHLSSLSERMDSLITQGLNLGINPKDIGRMFSARLAGFTGPAKKGKPKE